MEESKAQVPKNFKLKNKEKKRKEKKRKEKKENSNLCESNDRRIKTLSFIIFNFINFFGKTF